MSEYRYLIPTFDGSPWDRYPFNNHLVVTDVTWPRVGVYCPHETPWLIGSFQVSEVRWRLREEIGWTWSPEFMTGDGHLIKLGVGGELQELVGDDIRDRKAERVAADTPPVLSEEQRRASDRIKYNDANMRTRIPMRCKECRMSYPFRSETMERVAGGLWNLGIREVPLATLAALRPSGARRR